MKKKIHTILNGLSEYNKHSLKYIPEHNYDDLVDKLDALFSLNGVGSSFVEYEKEVSMDAIILKDITENIIFLWKQWMDGIFAVWKMISGGIGFDFSIKQIGPFLIVYFCVNNTIV